MPLYPSFLQFRSDRPRYMTHTLCPQQNPALYRLVAIALVICGVGSPATAAEVPIRQRAVDVLILQNGTRLLGASLPSEDDRTVSILVRGKWLQQNVPELYVRLITAKKASIALNPVIPLLTAHIESLEAAGVRDIERVGFLRERLQNLKHSAVGDVTPDVIIVEISDKLVRRKLLQKPRIRELAGLGILNALADVETSSQADVQAALQDIPATELIRSLPTEHTEDAENRFGRILLQTDRIFGTTCRLILHANRYISEQDANANPETLALELLAGQVQSQLSALLNGDVTASAGKLKPGQNAPAHGQLLPPQAAIIAAAQQADVVEVSEMKLHAASGSASVTIDLYYKNPGEVGWRFVGRVTGAATPQDISADQQQNIANDPRVKQITQLFGSLGAGANDLTKAISVGAAVEVAQKRAKESLQAFGGLAGVASANRLSVQRGTLTELP
ncbi:MAG TPA: hypothetical protein EYG03_15535 [Planctomycetes bacterium]|nr:hypothetical protein [Fuerstiella sp.]HIK93370.1 hypothetical protein [Planctomycetota bacterium]